MVGGISVESEGFESDEREKEDGCVCCVLCFVMCVCVCVCYVFPFFHHEKRGEAGDARRKQREKEIK